MEQSIYTYCYKRHFESGRGWGFFSYSDGIKHYFETDGNLKKLAGNSSYQIPQNRNVWLIPQITDNDIDIKHETDAIYKYHPTKFSYQIVNSNGVDVAVLNYGRNLGREIVNENRPLNKLIYTIIGSPVEVAAYPCFYYDIDEFVNLTREYFKSCTEQAPLLPAIKLSVGKSVTKEAVLNFLAADSYREDILIALFYSVLNERSGKHRPIIICDQKENIILWIAAYTLLFPSFIAKKISFSTYESLGTDQNNVEIPTEFSICGVYSPTVNSAPECKATNYDVQKFEKNDDIILFDLECGIYPHPLTDSFEEVIRAFCNGDDSALIEFFEHIENETIYRDFGREYSKLYKAANDNTELYHLYTHDTKTKIFNVIYPCLFDGSIDIASKQKAIDIISIAYEEKIVDKKRLLDDFFYFAANDLKSTSDNFNALKRIEPAFRIVNYTTEKLLKSIIYQSPDKWINYLTMQSGVSNSKLLELLKIYDLFENDDLVIAKKIFDKLRVTENAKLAENQIYDTFEKAYGVKKPLYELITVQKFIDITGDDRIIAERISRYYMIWEDSYKKGAIAQIDSLSNREDIYACIESRAFSNESLLDYAYELLIYMTTCRCSFSQNWYVRFLVEIRKASPTIQKNIICKMLLNPLFNYNQHMLGIINNVFDRYEFSSAQELADTSMLIFGILDIYGEQQVVVSVIGKAISQLSLTKKEWKKAIDMVQTFNIHPNNVKNVRSALLDFGLDYIDSESSGFTLLKKIFGKNKKKSE